VGGMHPCWSSTPLPLGDREARLGDGEAVAIDKRLGGGGGVWGRWWCGRRLGRKGFFYI
jgi:hypothetical protein